MTESPVVGPDALDRLAADGYLSIAMPLALRQECLALAERFYALSPRERMLLAASRADDFLGYVPSEQEVAALQLEDPTFSGARARGYCSFDFVEDPSVFSASGLSCAHHWPEDRQFAEVAEQLNKDLRAFTRKIAIDLFDQIDSPPSCAPPRQSLEGDTCSMTRLLLYERTAVESQSKPHTDYEFIAIIIAGENGLEVERPDGTWKAAHTNPGECIVLPGDVIAIATGGRVRAARHRVRFGNARRLSVVCFQGLRYETAIPYPGERTIPFGEHIVAMKVRGTPHLEKALKEGRLRLAFPIPLRNPLSN